MPKFQIDLEETIRHRADIEAPTEEAALALARQWEEDGELEDNVDFVEVDSSPLRVSADVVDRYTPLEVILGHERLSDTYQVTATVSRSKGSISYVMQTVPEGNYSQALSNLRWDFEELRIALFAPTLKPAYSISCKRVAEALSDQLSLSGDLRNSVRERFAAESSRAESAFPRPPAGSPSPRFGPQPP